MSKVKFKQQRVLSGRAARRYGEQERKREERQKSVDAWWALSPEERKQRMEDIEAFKRINKNGITLDDVKDAEEKAYRTGVRTGIDNTMRTCYAAICLALHELYGFGKERCSRVLNLTDEKITMALTSEEAIQEVYDSIGLEINFKDVPGERVQEVS